MDNKNIIESASDAIPNIEYLTSLYNYNLVDWNIVYGWKYILQSYFEELKNYFPEGAELIAQSFTISTKINENNKLVISTTDFDKINNHIDIIQKELIDTLQIDSKEKIHKTSEDYENDIYLTIQDLKHIIEEHCIDREILESFKIEIEELKKSLRNFLHADLSEKIKLYDKDNMEEDDYPITKQVMFINKRIDNFLKSQPEIIRTIILRRHYGHFNDIEQDARNYFFQKYNITNEAEEESHPLTNEQAYSHALNSLEISVYQLNTILVKGKKNTDGSIDHNIQPIVKKLLANIIQSLQSIKTKPTKWDIDILTRKIDLILAEFYNTVYGHLATDQRSAAIIESTLRLWDSIYAWIADVLQYKSYKIISPEYKFIKELLDQLEQECIKFPDTIDIETIVKERFYEFYILDKNIISNLDSEEIQTLKNLAINYQEYDLLNKLKDNKLLPSPKKLD